MDEIIQLLETMNTNEYASPNGAALKQVDHEYLVSRLRDYEASVTNVYLQDIENARDEIARLEEDKRTLSDELLELKMQHPED